MVSTLRLQARWHLGCSSPSALIQQREDERDGSSMDTVRRDASFLRRRRPMSTRRLIHLRCGHARRAVLALAMAAGAAAAGPVFAPDPSDFPVHGVDVSHHQGRIDWAMVAREPGQRFAYLKATQGRAHVDPEFARNWRGARAAGLKVGAYHYFSFCSGAAAQARNICTKTRRRWLSRRL